MREVFQQRFRRKSKYDESIRKMEIMDENKYSQLRGQYVGDTNNPMEDFYSDDYLDDEDEGESILRPFRGFSEH